MHFETMALHHPQHERWVMMSGNRIFNCQWKKKKLYLDSERDGWMVVIVQPDPWISLCNVRYWIIQHHWPCQLLISDKIYTKSQKACSVLCKLLLPGNLSFRLRCGLMLMRTQTCKMSDWGPLQLTGSDRISRGLTFCLPQQNWDEPIRPTRPSSQNQCTFFACWSSAQISSLTPGSRPSMAAGGSGLISPEAWLSAFFMHTVLRLAQKKSLVPHSEHWMRCQTSSQFTLKPYVVKLHDHWKRGACSCGTWLPGKIYSTYRNWSLLKSHLKVAQRLMCCEFKINKPWARCDP